MKRFILVPILVFFAFLVTSKEIAFAEGGIAWNLQGVPICEASQTQWNIRMVPDGSGGAIIVWEDYRNAGDCNIYAQRIDQDGTPLWNSDGVMVSTASNSQVKPVVVGDGSGGAIIAWEDYRGATPNICALRISGATGAPYAGWSSTGVVLNPTTYYYQINPDIVSDGYGGAIITWQEDSGIDWSIRAQRMSNVGTALWGMVKTVSQGPDPKDYPKIINDGTGNVIITWIDWRNDGGTWTNSDIYAQQIDISSGIPYWNVDGNAVTVASGNQIKPEIVGDGSGGAIITWTDYRDITTAPDIYAQRVDSTGDPVTGWTPDGIPICKERNGQYDPVIVENLLNGTTIGAIIMWVDMRDTTTGPDIYAEGVDRDYPPILDEEDLFIAGGPGSQLSPRLVSDNQGGGIGTCIDDGSKIFAQKRDEYGQLVWSFYPGVLVYEGTEVIDSQIINDGYGGAIVAWVCRGAGGDYDIFAQRIIDDAVIQVSAPISGTVTLSDGVTGITGVEIEALEDGKLVSSVTTDTSGDYQLMLVACSTYTVRATWMDNGIVSSVSKEAYAPSYNFDFTLEIDYELGSIAGNVSGVEENHIASLSCKNSKKVSGAGIQKILSPDNGIAFVELEQRGRVIVRVPVEMDGNYSIPNLLPGRFMARAYNGTIYSSSRTINLKEGETLRVDFTFATMPGEMVFNYPNPAKSGSTTIRYYCGYSDPEAEIKIYNISGELVEKVKDSEIDKTDAPIYKFLWDCKNSSGKEVASGIYIYIVEVKDKSNGENKKVIKRLAVIR